MSPPAYAAAPPHVHPCPECHARLVCQDPGCAIEPDLAMDDGTPSGAFVNCEPCDVHALTRGTLSADDLAAFLRLSQRYLGKRFVVRTDPASESTTLVEIAPPTAPLAAETEQHLAVFTRPETHAIEAGLIAGLLNHGARMAYELLQRRGAEAERPPAPAIDRDLRTPMVAAVLVSLRTAIQEYSCAVEPTAAALRKCLALDRSDPASRAVIIDALLAGAARARTLSLIAGDFCDTAAREALALIDELDPARRA